MISSPHNEKLKLVRKLRERKHREREGLFATEGEDLVEAGLAAGAEPRFLLSAAGSGLGGEEVEPELLAEVSALGSGTRAIAVWPQAWASEAKPPCVYLHGVADPGNVGAIVRTAHALLGGTRRARARAAPTRSGRRRCGRAWARSSVSRCCGPGSRRRRGRGPRWSRTAARASTRWPASRPSASAPSAAGLPPRCWTSARCEVTIPLRVGAAESLNVAAAAAIVCERLSSPAMQEAAE